MRALISIRVVICSFIAICAIVTPFGSAQAAPPQFEVFDVNDVFVDEFLTEGCGFEVIHTVTGRIKVSADQDGFFIARFALKHTVTGPGGSLTWPDVGIDKLLSVTDDGVTRVETIAATGVLGIRIVVPGHGVVEANTGREIRVITFDLVNEEIIAFQVLFDKGNSEPFDEGDMAIICGALAA